MAIARTVIGSTMPRWNARVAWTNGECPQPPPPICDNPPVRATRPRPGIDFMGIDRQAVTPLRQQRADWRRQMDAAPGACPGEGSRGAPTGAVASVVDAWVGSLRSRAGFWWPESLPETLDPDAGVLVGPGGHVLAGVAPGQVGLWSPQRGAWTSVADVSLGTGVSPEPQAVFRPDGSELVVALASGGLRSIGLNGAAPSPGVAVLSDALEAQAPGAYITDLALHPDGDEVAMLVRTAQGSCLGRGHLDDGRLQLGPPESDIWGPISVDAEGARIVYLRDLPDDRYPATRDWEALDTPALVPLSLAHLGHHEQIFSLPYRGGARFFNAEGGAWGLFFPERIGAARMAHSPRSLLGRPPVVL